MALAFVVADQASRRFFVNYPAVLRHRMAVKQIKQITRTWPNVRPQIPVAQKPNSYFWV